MRALLIIVILFTTINLFAQPVPCDTIEYPKLLNNSYQCTWQFFALNGTATAKVIEHQPASVACGGIASASITIVQLNADTIRIIDLCNQNNLPPGQKVVLTPGHQPNFQVSIPSHVIVQGVGHKKKLTKQEKEELNKQLSIWRTNEEYDQKILKTTWASLSIVVE